MKQEKVVRVASACGAAIGALAVRFGSNILASCPAFAFDRALLANHRYLLPTVPWILFSMYWEFAARGAAEAKSSEAKLSRGVHVALANIAVVLEIVPIRGWGRFLPLTWLSIAAGLAVEFAGLSLAICIDGMAKQAVRSRSDQLITNGLLVMYIGAALADSRRRARKRCRCSTSCW